MNHKKIILAIALISTIIAQSFIASAQAPFINSIKLFGGTSAEDNNSFYTQNMIATSGTGYVTAGTSSSNDGNVTGNHGGMFGAALRDDFWVTKHTSGGAIAWQKSFGSKGKEYAHAITPTADGGYIIAGSVYIDTFTTAGAVFGQVFGYHNINDGLFSFDGWPMYDGWVVKVNVNGLLEWERAFGGEYPDELNDIKQTLDGGYIAVGYTMSTDGDVSGLHTGLSPHQVDAWLIKLSSTGTLQWQRCLGSNGPDFGYSVLQTPDSDYVVAGVTKTNGGDVTGTHGNNDGWVVKVSKTGSTVLFSTSIGGSLNDELYCIKSSFDGGYVACGKTNSSSSGNVPANNGGYDAWLVKLTGTGALTYNKCFGGTNNETANSIIVNPTVGFVMAGTTNSNNGNVTGFHGTPGLSTNNDMWVAKTSLTGSLTGNLCIGTSTGDEKAFSITSTSSCLNTFSYLVAGRTNSNTLDFITNHGSYDRCVARLFDGFCPTTTLTGISGLTKNKVTLSWATVSCAAGYTLQYKVGSAATFTSVTLNGSGSTVKKLTNLIPNTTYLWRVRTNCGTGSSSAFTATSSFTTPLLRSGDDINNADDELLSIAPNPTTGIFQLSFNSDQEKADLKILNIIGEIVMSKTIASADGIFDQQVDVSAFPAGIYFVCLETPDGALLRKKFLKQN